MPVITTTSIRPLLYNSVAEAVFNEIATRTGRYYYFLGKIQKWSDELNPPGALESLFYEKETRRNIVVAKEVRPGEVCLVANRIDWKSNVVYDAYDDRYSDEVIGVDIISGGASYSANTYITISGGNGTGATAKVVLGSGSVVGVNMLDGGYGYNSAPTVTITDPDGYGAGASLAGVINKPYSGANSLVNAKFYVVNNEFNIYKCLDNNGNLPSTVMPVDTLLEPFTLSDGYKWKFIGSIPPSLRNKFLTNEAIPVVSALTKSFYSKGEIKRIVVNATGNNYTSASITVDGDGYLESDPIFLISTTVTNSGNGYTTANVTIDPPVNFSNIWYASSNYAAGTRIKSGVNIYEAQNSGISAVFPPTHTTGSFFNGTVNFKYLGTVATGNATLSSGNVTGITLDSVLNRVNLSSGGFGYTSPPLVTFSGGGGTGAAAYSTLRGNSVNKIIITDIGSGYTSAPTITIGTQWAANTRTNLAAQISNASKLYTVISANNNFRVSDIKYDNFSANLSSLYRNVTGLAINNTGTALYVSDANTNTIAQFNLPSQFNINSITANGNISIGVYDTKVQDIAFSRTGNVMYVVGAQNDKVYRFNLANSWNVVSASYVSNLNIAPYETDPTCMFIDNSGLRLYISGTTNDKIESFSLSTPWDITTATSTGNISIAGYEANITGLFFNSTGRIMTTIGTNSRQLNQFYLSNAWNVATASYFTSFPVDSFDSQPLAVYYGEASDKLYFAGNVSDTVYQFSLPRSVFFGTTGPAHISGNVYNGDALLAYAGNAAAASATLKYGSGYSKQPNIVITGNGLNARAVVNVEKSDAVVSPIIENGKIVNVTVEDGGIGYTYASLLLSGDGAGAILSADLSEGDIETLQGNNELLAKEGAIDSIKVISGGYGYSSANVTVTGDGIGASANAIISNGRVIKVTINASGEGYTFADVVIQGDGKGASARAIFPPFGGHGSDVVSELYSRSLAMYSSIANERNQGFNVVNDYRQLGLIKDLERFSDTGFFKGVVGSGCHVLTGNTISGLITEDVILTSSRNADYLVVSKTNSSVLVLSLDAIEPIVGDTMSLNGTALFSVSSVITPDINKYSGKLLYIDNKDAFTTSGQTVTIKTVFKF